MFTTLRTKLLVGLTPLLAIMVGLGLWAIAMFSKLGNNIDVILKENYQSVLYAEQMKEALERLDSSLLFAIGGEEEQAREQFDQYRPRFEENLRKEKGNITLPGEGEMVQRLDELYARYLKLIDQFFAYGKDPARKPQRTRLYFGQLLPTFQEIKHQADAILGLNQRNMEDESRRAREAASVSIRLMVLVLLGAAVVATSLAMVLSRSILKPIHAVTLAARAMAQRDLDQVVPVVSRDELGELAGAFNTMARTIREYRAAGTARLLRAQKTAQATIDSFPDPVVVVDPTGVVERSNPAALRILGVAPSDNGSVPWVAPPQLRPPLDEVLGGRADYLPTSLDHAVCIRNDGQERFFLPRVLAIRGEDGLLGAAVVLQEVTKFRLLDQLKSDMVSTVSHELKTPLTSVQMAVHLLLEEVVGPLTPKQTELLLAARHEADRLLAMINDLLDLTRIEQGRLRLDLQPVNPRDLVNEAVERASAQGRTAGITFETSAAPDLPPVLADRERVEHVFDNLIGNALRHSERGKHIRVTARAAGDSVRFTVEDNGEGIPAESLPHVFEKFYRVQGARHGGGAVLGLAIVREIVTAHDGQIDVTSQPGSGTTFTFTLPAEPAEARLLARSERTP